MGPTLSLALAVVAAQVGVESPRLIHEVHLGPVAQFNGKFSEHYGSHLAWVGRFGEGFGVRFSLQNHWVARQTSFNQELIAKARQEAQAATSALVRHLSNPRSKPWTAAGSNTCRAALPSADPAPCRLSGAKANETPLCRT